MHCETEACVLILIGQLFVRVGCHSASLHQELLFKLSNDDDVRYQFTWTTATKTNLEVLEAFARDVDKHLGKAESWSSIKHVCDAIQNVKTNVSKFPAGFGKSSKGYHFCWFVRCAAIVWR